MLRQHDQRLRATLAFSIIATGLGLPALVRGDSVDDVLGSLSPRSLAVAWIAPGEGEAVLVETVLRDERWSSVGAEVTLVVDSAREPSVGERFGVGNRAIGVVLDPRGEELVRVERAETREETIDLLRDALHSARIHRSIGASPPRDPTTAFWLGYYHWIRGERSAARAHFDRLSRGVEERPDPAEDAKALYGRSLLLRGEYLLDTGKLTRANALLEEATRYGPTARHIATLALARARCLRRLGEVGRAIEVLSDSLRVEIAGPAAVRTRILFSLGYLHLDQGRAHRARTYLERCLSAAPNSPVARRAEILLARANGIAPKRGGEASRERAEIRAAELGWDVDARAHGRAARTEHLETSPPTSVSTRKDAADGLTAGESSVDFVPVPDLVLPELPAKEDDAPVELRREVD